MLEVQAARRRSIDLSSLWWLGRPSGDATRTRDASGAGREVLTLPAGKCVAGTPHASAQWAVDLREFPLLALRVKASDAQGASLQLELKNRFDQQLLGGWRKRYFFAGAVAHEFQTYVFDIANDLTAGVSDVHCSLIAFCEPTSDLEIEPEVWFLQRPEGDVPYGAADIRWSAPGPLRSWPGPHHAHLAWEVQGHWGPGYNVWGAPSPDGPWEKLTTSPIQTGAFCEFLGKDAPGGRYFSVTAVGVQRKAGADGFAEAGTSIVQASVSSDVVAVSPTGEQGLEDEDMFLDFVQRTHLEYFLGYAHGTSAAARETARPQPQLEGEMHKSNMVSVGGTGFGIAAMIVGVARGFLQRSAAVARLLRILEFLENADRFHGFWPHWLDGGTGRTIPFSQFDDGADVVESCFVFQSLLCARSYFASLTDEGETSLRGCVTRLWEAADFDHFVVDGKLMWHWSPAHGFRMNMPIVGFNECHIAYVLGLCHPKRPIAPAVYSSGWVGNPSRYQESLKAVNCLFWTHYSYIGFNPKRGDPYCSDYFHDVCMEWSQAHVDYAAKNPKGHCAHERGLWGLTASFDKWGYSAHAPGHLDNGTISPTAACCAYAYLPDASLDCMKSMYNDFGETLWGPCGFKDSIYIEPGTAARAPYVSNLYVAIDQGPIPCMLENGRTGLLWELFDCTEEARVAYRHLQEMQVELGALALPMRLFNRVFRQCSLRSWGEL